MKTAVVGGTGNISTSIVRLLLEQGHEVVCFNRGLKGELPRGARLIRGDRKDRPVFEELMQKERFDAAIDMICFTAEDAESSVRAFMGVGCFVMCSTVCTYGVQYDYLPVTEDHPLRAFTPYGINKIKADGVFMREYYENGFPAVIIKPSSTYGPKMGMLRQIAWDFSWIDRIRKGKPIVVSGDGLTVHQFMHVDDAAKAFAGVLGRPECVGQTYNLAALRYVRWDDYHAAAMNVLGRKVEMVHVPMQTLETYDIPNYGILPDEFAYNCYYSMQKLTRDLPEFSIEISLEQGMELVFSAMDRDGRIPDSDGLTWEDEIIAAQKGVWKKGV